MALDRLVTLLRSRAVVPDDVLEEARRSIPEEERSAFRLASVLVERGAIGETTAQALLSETTVTPPGADAAGAGSGAGLEGRTLGRWLVRKRLSEGGMGSVWLAEHLDLGRQAALKLILDDLAQDPALARRFENEARALAKIQHPNVCAILDFGLDGGRRFILMEFIDGPSLEQVMKRKGALDAARAAAYVRDAARGLEAIHQAGLVHRDVKPSNILIAEGGHAKVVDLGVATGVDAALGVTTTGAVVGTPLYMAPEQAEGRRVDARADLYALGATLYHAIAGDPPFRADSAVGVLMKHIRERPARAPLERRGAPPRLTEIVLRLLAKDPKARFGSARELADALDAWLASPHMPAETALPGSETDEAASPPEEPAPPHDGDRGAPRRRAPPLALAVVGGAFALAIFAIGIWATRGRTPGDGAPAGPPATASAPAASTKEEAGRLLALADAKEEEGKLDEARVLVEAALAVHEDPGVRGRLRALQRAVALERELGRARAATGTAAVAGSGGAPVEAPRAAPASTEPRPSSATAAKGGPAAPDWLAACVPAPSVSAEVARAREEAASLEDARDAALGRSVTADVRLIEAAVARLGPAPPLAPRTPHEAALAALMELRPSLQTEDGRARLDWELLRRSVLSEAARGFGGLVMSATGPGLQKFPSKDGAFVLEGTPVAVEASGMTIRIAGGAKATVPLAEFSLADVATIRSDAFARARRRLDGPGLEGPADVPCAFARAFLAADAGDAQAALDLARKLPTEELRPDLQKRVNLTERNAELTEAILRREVALAFEDARVDRLAQAWARLEGPNSIEGRLDGALKDRAGVLARSIPRRCALWLASARVGRHASALAELMPDVNKRYPEVAKAAPEVFERMFEVLFLGTAPGESLAPLKVGGEPAPGRAMTELPRLLSPPAKGAMRQDLIGPAIAGRCDGVLFSFRREASARAGLLLEFEGGARLSIYVEDGRVGWDERLPSGAPGRSGTKDVSTRKGGWLEVKIEGRECRIAVDQRWERDGSESREPPPTLTFPWIDGAAGFPRGLALLAAGGDVTYFSVTLRRASD